MAGTLGRIAPTDWTHVNKFPLTTEILDELPPRPVVLGINWYSAFDYPQKDSTGHYWIARSGNLGSIRGGHCVCLKPRRAYAYDGWWAWHDQVSEGICVSEGCARNLAYFNRRMYQPRPIYDECKKRDGYPGEGTWVSVGFDVLREVGAVPALSGEAHWYRTDQIDKSRPFIYNDGINANRWARSVDDVLQVLGYQDVGYVDVINSWGKSYPNLVRLPVDVLQTLFDQDGEFGIATDR